MCLGIPGQVIAITDVERNLAQVDVGGVKREISLACIVSDEHPLHREDCSAYDGDVCTTANGVAGCVNPDFIPCSANANFCSADFTTAYSCGTTGLVWRIEDCAAYGQICKDGWCGHV